MTDDGVLGLAKIRKNRGISLEQIAQSTKISIRSLQAIERGDFQKLPGGIYNTNYIRQYARAIDYDENVLLSYYQETLGTADTMNDSVGPNSRGLLGGYRPSTLLGS